ncbi:MAG: hypothetical protein JWO90_2539, partial [Solirubrobacterales bacterium]|nr:hypothetical protein [Solirubrobacterales bacterium]
AVAAVARRGAPRRFTAGTTPTTDTRRPFRFTTTGALLLPAGTTRTTGCRGRVAVRVKAGTRTLSLRRVFLRRDCTFTSTVAFGQVRRFEGRRSLAVQVRFEGNDVLLPRAAATRTVAVRR